jgi:capsular polysaccharide biosynthesis protein
MTTQMSDRRRSLRLWIAVAAFAALAGIAAAVYAYTTDDRYEASADLLVTPVAADDPNFVGFSALRDGDGDASPAETAARLVETQRVADAVAVRLGFGDVAALRDKLETRPDPGANVVGVLGTDADPVRAAQIANAFADETVTQRNERFATELNATITRLREQLTPIPAARRNDPRVVALSRRLGALQSLVGSGDPTLRILSDARAPGDAVWPKPALLIGAAVVSAALLGALLVLILSLARRPRPVADPPVDLERERGLAERERTLERRAHELEERARALERTTRDAAKSGELDARERELEGVAADLESRSHSIDDAEHRLDERVSAVTARETALARRAADLAKRERELEEKEAAVPPPTPAPAPAGGAPARSSAYGAWSLGALERLVEERQDEFPQRREEWRSYLFYLREHADPDGRLPAPFDPLVDDVFAELVAET